MQVLHVFEYKLAFELCFAHDFAGFGAVDQGAFNQFYEKDIRGKPISKVRAEVLAAHP